MGSRERKIYKLIRSLPEAELDEFGTYLASPWLNPSQVLLDFFTSLRAELGKEESPDPKVVDKATGRRGTFSLNYYDKMCNGLYSAALDYLAMKEFRRDGLATSTRLLGALNRLNLNEFADDFLQRSEKPLKEGKEDSDKWLSGFRQKEEWIRFLFRQPRRPSGNELEVLDRLLDRFYFGRKLEIAGAISSYNNLFNTDMEARFLPEMEELIGRNLDHFPPLIRLRFFAMRLAREKQDADYFRFREILYQEGEHIEAGELRDLLNHALNFLHLRINTGKLAFLGEVRNAYRLMLEKGWLLVGEDLPSAHFKNVISVYCQLEEVGEAEAFFSQYRDHLLQDFDGYVQVYNRAFLDYYKGDFRESIQGMETILTEFKSDVFYSLDARVYQLRAYFERNDPGDDYLAESLMNSFRVYLRRISELSDADVESYANFLKAYRKLFQLRELTPAAREKKKAKLLQGIKQLRLGVNQEWLLKRIEIL